MFIERLYIKKNKPNPLKIYWWRYEYPEKLNFGDEITSYILENLFNTTVEWTDLENCQLIGAGSILEIANEISPDNEITVWGSGFIKDGSFMSSNHYKYIAVRGKLTRNRLPIEFNSVPLGDPGLLISVALPLKRSSNYLIGVIPHYADLDSPAIEELLSVQGSILINPLDSPDRVAKKINQCDLILSSSLHGLIVSDSYRVPNYWIPLSKNLTGGDYKFRDYYSAYDQNPEPVDWHLFKDQDYIRSSVAGYLPKPGIELIQNELITTLSNELGTIIK